jgi:methylase of polypeptide subunit release factors
MTTADSYAHRRIKKMEAMTFPLWRAFNDIVVRVDRGVYLPGDLTQDYLDVLQDSNYGISAQERVFDLGTGCGVQSIAAAKKNAKVVGSDVLPEAVSCAYDNAMYNGVLDRVEVRLGNGLEAIRFGEKFDTIIASLPQDDGVVQGGLEYSFFDPGYQLRNSLAEKAKTLLRPGGRILFCQIDATEREYPLSSIFSTRDYDINTVFRRRSTSVVAISPHDNILMGTP